MTVSPPSTRSTSSPERHINAPEEFPQKSGLSKSPKKDGVQRGLTNRESDSEAETVLLDSPARPKSVNVKGIKKEPNSDSEVNIGKAVRLTTMKDESPSRTKRKHGSLAASSDLSSPPGSPTGLVSNASRPSTDGRKQARAAHQGSNGQTDTMSMSLKKSQDFERRESSQPASPKHKISNVPDRHHSRSKSKIEQSHTEPRTPVTDRKADDGLRASAPFAVETGLASAHRRPSVAIIDDGSHKHSTLASHKPKKDSSGRTQLHRACEKGNLSEVEQILSTNPELVHEKDNAGYMAMHEASLNGHDDIVTLLLKFNAEIDAASSIDRDTPLIDAVENGHVDVVQVLLDAGADPRKRNAKGSNALDVNNSKNDGFDEIESLLKTAMSKLRGKRPSREEDGTGRASVPLEVDSSRQSSTASPSQQSPSLDSPFLGAQASKRRTGRTEQTRQDLLWLDSGKSGLQKLREAVKRADAQMVVQLLEIGNKPDIEMLIQAARGGHSDVVQFLLAYDCECDPDLDVIRQPRKRERLGVDSYPIGEDTPMLAAIGRGNVEVLKTLLGSGRIDPKKRDGERMYWQIAEDRKGDNWEAEVQFLRDEASKLGNSQTSRSNQSRKSKAVNDAVEGGKDSKRQKEKVKSFKKLSKPDNPTSDDALVLSDDAADSTRTFANNGVRKSKRSESDSYSAPMAKKKRRLITGNERLEGRQVRSQTPPNGVALLGRRDSPKATSLRNGSVTKLDEEETAGNDSPHIRGTKSSAVGARQAQKRSRASEESPGSKSGTKDHELREKKRLRTAGDSELKPGDSPDSLRKKRKESSPDGRKRDRTTKTLEEDNLKIEDNGKTKSAPDKKSGTNFGSKAAIPSEMEGKGTLESGKQAKEVKSVPSFGPAPEGRHSRRDPNTQSRARRNDAPLQNQKLARHESSKKSSKRDERVTAIELEKKKQSHLEVEQQELQRKALLASAIERESFENEKQTTTNRLLEESRQRAEEERQILEQKLLAEIEAQKRAGLPSALRQISEISSSRQLCADDIEKFLPLYTVTFSETANLERRSDENQSPDRLANGQEWISSIQAALILGDSDHELGNHRSFQESRVPVSSEDQKSLWLVLNPILSLDNGIGSMPYSGDYLNRLKSEKEKFMALSSLFWVRFDDLVDSLLKSDRHMDASGIELLRTPCDITPTYAGESKLDKLEHS